MTKIRLLVTAVLPAVLACGCDCLSHTENGALAGGAIGAGTGALIGHATGHTGAGALIGAGVGALTGGLVGHAADKSEERSVAAAEAQQARQLGMTDVVQLAQSHVADNVIISQIRVTSSVFHLSAQDTIWLKQNGVSDAVVQEMLATERRYPARRVYHAAPVYAEQVYVVEPAPSPVSVGVGVGYCRRF